MVAGSNPVSPTRETAGQRRFSERSADRLECVVGPVPQRIRQPEFARQRSEPEPRSDSPSTAARAVSSEVCPYTSPVIADRRVPEQVRHRLDVHAALEPATAAECRNVCTPTPVDAGGLCGAFDHPQQVARVDRRRPARW